MKFTKEQIKSNCFWEEISSYINTLAYSKEDAFWLVGDINTVHSNKYFPEKNTIYTDKELHNVLLKEGQFIWGVFICFLDKSLAEKYLSLSLLAEWEEKPYTNESIFELRAFDTSYMELYKPQK